MREDFLELLNLNNDKEGELVLEKLRKVRPLKGEVITRGESMKIVVQIGG